MKPRVDEKLIAAAEQLPFVEPDAERREDVRTALLIAARTERPATESRGPRRARLAWWLGAPALAAAVVLFVAIDRGPKPAPVPSLKMATVEASEGAHFTHTSMDTDEVVRLTSGRVTVRVQKLEHEEQRFRVVTSDAEVEVRGTSFDVEVVDDRLREVVVHEGLVEVRPKGRPALLLAAGERWTATTVTAAIPAPELAPAPAPAPTPELAPAPAPAPAPTPAPIASLAPEVEPEPEVAPEPEPEPELEPEPEPEPEPTEAEVAFQDGWRTLRAGNYGNAADAFHTVIALDPDGPLAQDARYWRAIAQARAGRAATARISMARFLEKHPKSSRAGEISTMLGWLLVDVGDREAAQRRFKAAMHDDDEKVRNSARAGLEALRNN